MNDIETKIREYVRDEKKVELCLAMLSIGMHMGDSTSVVMQHIMAHVLLDFHNMPPDKSVN